MGKEHRFRWFSCSLLFVFEGDVEGKDRAPKPVLKLIDFTNFVVLDDYAQEMQREQNEQNEVDSDDSSDVDSVEEDNDNEEAEGKEEMEVEVDEDEALLQLRKDLDSDGQPDHGILFGLECLRKLLSELKEMGGIKQRTKRQWALFREGVEGRDKALAPFADHSVFNEATTI